MNLNKNHQAGVTLVELVISVGISSIIFLGITTLIYQSNRAIKINQQKQLMLDNLIGANIALVRNMGQALGIRWRQNNSINNGIVRTNGATSDCWINVPGFYCGQIREYRAPVPSAVTNFSLAVTPPVDTLAIFLSEGEKSTSTGGNIRTALNAVGVFYQRQTTQYSGVLWITNVTGNNPTNLRASNNAAGIASSVFYENIVDIEILNPTPSNALNTYLSGVDIRIKMRAFFDADRSRWRFCRPDEVVAACQTTATFADLERVIHINFRNNIVNNIGSNERFFDRNFGPLYFFDFNFPRISKDISTEGI